jgi:plastocyanin domain-containing protein
MTAIAWTPDRILAVAAGAGLVLFLYVYFFGRRRETAAAAASGGRQSAEIVVSGGYRPDLIVAKRGVPLTLIFDRREDNPCSDEVVLPEFGVRRALPAHARTAIEVIPQRAGEFPFTCGMSMLHGKIRVVD